MPAPPPFESPRQPARGQLQLLRVAHRWGIAILIGASACVAPEAERLSCGDTLPPDRASFRELTVLVLDPFKGCTASGCHHGDTRQGGLQLDQPALIYEELSSRAADVYATLASGEMPLDGVPWTDEDLRLFRSWYCNGAFPP